MSQYQEFINNLSYNPHFDSRKNENNLESIALYAIRELIRPFHGLLDLSPQHSANIDIFRDIFIPHDQISSQARKEALKIFKNEKYNNNDSDDCFDQYLVKEMNAELMHHGAIDLERDIRQSMKHEYVAPQLYFILGCPGVGKSSMLRYFQELINNNPKINDLYLKSSSSSFNVGVATAQSPIKQMLEAIENSLQLPVDANADISARMRSIVSCCNNNIIMHTVDNLDNIHDPKEVLDIVKDAMYLHEQFKSLQNHHSNHIKKGTTIIIIAMRKTSFQQLSLTGILEREPSKKFILTPAPLALILKKRFDMIEEAIDRMRVNSKPKIIRIGIDDTYNESIPTLSDDEVPYEFNMVGVVRGKFYNITVSQKNAVDFFISILAAMNSQALAFFRHLCGGNLRTQLQLFLRLFTDIPISRTQTIRNIIYSILEFEQTTLNNRNRLTIGIHHIAQALQGLSRNALGVNDFFCWETLFENSPYALFAHIERRKWWNENKGWWHYLIKIRLLQYLNASPKGMAVYKIVEQFERLGYPQQSIVDALKSFSNYRLINTDFAYTPLIRHDSEQKIILMPSGLFFLKNLFHQFGFCRWAFSFAPSHFTNKEYSNELLYPIAFLKIIRNAEAIETQIASQDRNVLDFLNSVRGEHTIWESLQKSFLKTLTQIKRSVERRAGDELEVTNTKYIVEAISECQSLSDTDTIMLEENELKSKVKKLPDCCKQCIDSICCSTLPEMHVHPYTKFPWRLEPIVKLIPNQPPKTVGAELFYMQYHITPWINHTTSTCHDFCSSRSQYGCSAGDLFRMMRQFTQSCPKFADRVFLHHLMQYAEQLRLKNSLEFVSINISSELFEETDLLDCSLLSHYTENWKVMIELPERAINITAYVKSINKLCNNPSFAHKVLLDDYLSSGNAAALPTNSHRKHCILGEKVDYETFQRLFKEKCLQSYLSERIQNLTSSSQIVIVEGIAHLDHMQFLQKIVDQSNATQSPILNLHIQGHMLQILNPQL
ncbi:MAG: hypothetical protein HQM03_04995 [Magnetococcales bacterium]|nr:hypothetical protein [Magnetococcales bacterium]